MKEQILQTLKDAKDYISGQELGETFSVSRTAIWKAVNALKNDGYEIESVTNRGYRLVSCPDILNSDEIKTSLHTNWWGNEVKFFDNIDSTNNEIKREAEAGAKQGLLAVTEEQTAGRGRRGRAWTSPKGSGIWMSFLLKPDFLPEQASMLTIVAALATAKAIKNVTGLQVKIKWPNDIIYNKKKIVGILTEMSTEMTCINYVVVGIGINANTEEFPSDIRDKATSLMLEMGNRIRRSTLIAEVGSCFEQLYETFETEKDLSAYIDEYNSQMINMNKQVIIEKNGEVIERTAIGIDNKGELLVKDSEGNISTVLSGEVSVRGIYGYI